MHELGVVFHIADSVKQIAKDNNAEHISKVVLQVGEVTAIVNEYLIDCWNWNAKKSDVLNGCQLVIEKVDGVTYCEACKSKYSTVTYGKICPNCGSEKTYLLQGDGLEIKEITVD